MMLCEPRVPAPSMPHTSIREDWLMSSTDLPKPVPLGSVSYDLRDVSRTDPRWDKPGRIVALTAQTQQIPVQA
jgi:hypothetical protein